MRRRADETKSLSLHSVQKSCVSGAPPHMRCILHTRADKALYMDSNCAGEKNWRRRYRTPNLEEADLAREEI